MRIPKSNIYIDGFAKRAEAILISHYHGDHLGGLPAARTNCPIICSPITAALLSEFDAVPKERLLSVEPNSPSKLNLGSHEIRVFPLPANHCPGALMYVLELEGRRILYTGDFRLDSFVRRHVSPLGPIDLLYLDCTYADPKYRFPPQKECIQEMLDLIAQHPHGEVLIGLYTIGKNRLVEAIWRKFHERVYVPPRRYRAYCIMGMKKFVTSDSEATRFRGYSLGYLNKYFKRDRRYGSKDVLVIVPTGWAVDADYRDPAYHYVPYSEHCDYEELEEFKRLVNARRVVAI